VELVIMRAFLLIAIAASAAACNPYDPNLPPVPFRCGTSDPPGEAVCPSGYVCVGDVCEEDEGDGPDADIRADAGCQDLAEPNDMISSATLSPVWDQMMSIQYEGLSLCPMMDTDYFRINQPTNCAAIPCPNLDVLVEFTDLGAPPTLAITNATGVVVAPGGSTGTSGEVKAVLNNVAQGQYYVRVTSQPVLSHYRLTIDGTRTE
jgi:hypothetical protein